MDGPLIKWPTWAMGIYLLATQLIQVLIALDVLGSLSQLDFETAAFFPTFMLGRSVCETRRSLGSTWDGRLASHRS